MESTLTRINSVVISITLLGLVAAVFTGRLVPAKTVTIIVSQTVKETIMQLRRDGRLVT